MKSRSDSYFFTKIVQDNTTEKHGKPKKYLNLKSQPKHREAHCMTPTFFTSLTLSTIPVPTVQIQAFPLK
jgi:hypothetical protein